MNKTKVLFIINGLGLGNSTRCSAIIHELFNLGYQIDVISSANGTNYFKSSDEISELFSFRALLYGKANGKLSVTKTILMLPSLIMLFIKNCVFLNTLIKKNNYAAVVFDSDYSVVSLKWQRRRPLLIAINNAVVIVQKCKKLAYLPRNIRLQYWIEKLDCWFHYIIPDLVICPVIRSDNLIEHKKIKFIPPIIRPGLICKPEPESVKNILIMLSGSQFGSDIYFLNKLPKLNKIKISIIGKEGVSNEQISFYGKVYNNQNLINNADMLVINAGFSAISEAIVLKKPAIVIPIENHAEQFINSQLFAQYGLGLLATQENAHEKIIDMLAGFQNYQEVHKNFNAPLNGAEIASSLIFRYVESRNGNL